jgi:dihydrofolate reductase
MREIVLILAMAENGVIGKDGAIPWRISDDLKRFKALTMGQTVVMGRKTWDSLPRKPLPDRANVVVTRNPNWSAEGAIPLHSIGAAQAAGLLMGGVGIRDQFFVIGGAEIYHAFLPSATRIELTEVHRAFDGDAVFDFDRAGWQEIARERHATPDGLEYSYVTLVRAAPTPLV